MLNSISANNSQNIKDFSIVHFEIILRDNLIFLDHQLNGDISQQLNGDISQHLNGDISQQLNRDISLAKTPTASKSEANTSTNNKTGAPPQSKTVSPRSQASLTSMFKVKKRGGPTGDIKTVGVPSCYGSVGSGSSTSDPIKREVASSSSTKLPLLLETSASGLPS